jgi:hypothetical protein
LVGSRSRPSRFQTSTSTSPWKPRRPSSRSSPSACQASCRPGTTPAWPCQWQGVGRDGGGLHPSAIGSPQRRAVAAPSSEPPRLLFWLPITLRYVPAWGPGWPAQLAVSALPSSSRRRDPDGTPPQASGASLRGDNERAVGQAAVLALLSGVGSAAAGSQGGRRGDRRRRIVVALVTRRAALRGVGGGIDTPLRVAVGLVGRRRLRRLVGGLGR